MDSVVAEVSRAEVVEPAPAAMKAVRVERSFRGRAEPHVVIDADRWFAIRGKADAPLLRALPRASHQTATECSSADELDGRSHPLGRAGLSPHLDDSTMLLHRGHHPLAFDNVVAVGLLDVHVLPGQAREDRRDCMPMIGRADDDRVEALVVDQLPKVGHCLRLGSLILFDRRDRLPELGGVEVRQSDHFTVLVAGERVHQREGPSPRSDAADTNTFAGDGLPRRIGRQQRSGSGNTPRGRGQKLTALHGRISRAQVERTNWTRRYLARVRAIEPRRARRGRLVIQQKSLNHGRHGKPRNGGRLRTTKDTNYTKEEGTDS